MDAEQVLRLAERLIIDNPNVALKCEGCQTIIADYLPEVLRRAAAEGWQVRFDEAFCGNCCKEADGA